MEAVYHEKQEGRLCGQHCLNNLLQGQYFTAVELAALARQMDLAERRHMAEAGVNTEDFRRFMEQPSGNMDDTGMFSVQVLTSALRVWDLSLVPITSTTSTTATTARTAPEDQRAFICNYKSHWFTVRKLGHQWFNLNSLLSHPELISNTYLSLFLSQLEHEGYSIFVVEGELPPSEADESLRITPATQTTPPRLSLQEEEEDLREALALSLSSLQTHPLPPPPPPSSSSSSSPSSSSFRPVCRQDSAEQDDLQRAIALSLTCGGGSSGGGCEAKVNEGSSEVKVIKSRSRSEEDDLDDLQTAILMSLEQEGGGGAGERRREERREPTLEEIRERRLNYLAKSTNP